MLSAISLLDALLPQEIKQIPQSRISYEEVETVTRDNLRFYQTPAGSFPSVTSVLGFTDPKIWLEEWRERIGRERADKITARSCERGELMHAALEERLKNNPNWIDHCQGDPEAVIMAKAIASDIIENIDEVFVTEAPLFSPSLRIAGRIDGGIRYQGRPAILDFKNSRRIKTRDDIHTYFMQTALYSRMLREMFGIECNDMYVAMAFSEDHLGQSTVFHEKYDDWIGPAEERVNDFWKEYKPS